MNKYQKKNVSIHKNSEEKSKIKINIEAVTLIHISMSLFPLAS